MVVFLSLEPDFETSSIAADVEVMKARRTGNGAQEPFRPAQSKMWWRVFTNCAPMWFSRRMWKRPQVSFYQMRNVTALASAAHDVGAIMVWTVSRRGVSGSI